MKQVTETINDKEYTVTKMVVTNSLLMVTRLSKVLGKDFSADGDIMQALIGAMADERVVSIIKDLVKQVQCDVNGMVKGIDFDTHFIEYPNDLLPVVGLSLRENVLPFFAPKALETLMQTVTKDLVESAD